MSSKNFSLRLDNGQANVSVSLILPTSPTPVTVPVPISVPTVVPQPIITPTVKRPRSIEFTTSGSAGSETISYWTVPNGVYSITVTAIGAGAGGSSGSEGNPYVSGGGGGSSGGYNKKTLSVTPGQRLAYKVGRPGTGAPRTSGGNVKVGTPGGDTYFHTVVSRGGEPATSNYTKAHYQVGGIAPSGGQNGGDGEIIKSSTDGGSIVTAGGSGGSVSGFGTGGAGGQPSRLVDFSVNSRQIPGARAVTYPAWNTTMNQYAVWDQNLAAPSASASMVVFFPFTGTYTFSLQSDNAGSISLDGSTVLSTNSNFNSSPARTTRTVTAGNHTITVSGQNAGGYSSSNPAGIAALITGTGRSTPPNDGNGYSGSGYGAGGGGGFGQSGGSPPQGGGGNGAGGYIKVEWEE